MRYSWIDGIYVEVDRCIHCPFFSYEKEDSRAECNYPTPVPDILYFHLPIKENDVHSMCPLRIKM